MVYNRYTILYLSIYKQKKINYINILLKHVHKTYIYTLHTYIYIYIQVLYIQMNIYTCVQGCSDVAAISMFHSTKSLLITDISVQYS